VREIILPSDVKPVLEWVNDRALPKVSPTPRHALAQGTFVTALRVWADARGSGFVGPECRFQVQPPGEIRRTLVPDVAYVSFDRISPEELSQTSAPAVAPDVVIEIRSPSDRKTDIDEKVRVYLAAGTVAVFLVDPDQRSVKVVDASGERDLSHTTVAHDVLPGFSLEPVKLFEISRPRRA
jgi:Uma2 family endonuclease